MKTYIRIWNEQGNLEQKERIRVEDPTTQDIAQAVISLLSETMSLDVGYTITIREEG